MSRPLPLVGIWIGLTAGAFFSQALHGEDWDAAIRQSYNQFTALFTVWFVDWIRRRVKR